MITVSHLTKVYGSHKAVDDLSFTIEKGRIYGFLGPNGAGKSTTMNILTGCLAATKGDVKIGGYDIFENPIEAKRLIGYLPELPPLYTDMTPSEYLRFVGKAKGLKGEELREQMAKVMNVTKIEDVSGRLIKNLSKGYRQRVGIAQALMGNPEIIILDEPTVGLDPKQIIEIRELIRELGKDHTVILSSHILSEVSAVCDEIMIISGGKLVASDTNENLTALFTGKRTLRLCARCEAISAASIVSVVEGVEQVDIVEEAHDGLSVIKITLADDAFFASESVAQKMFENGIAIHELAIEKASLEDVFLELTQTNTTVEQSEETEQPEEEQSEEEQPEESDRDSEKEVE